MKRTIALSIVILLLTFALLSVVKTLTSKAETSTTTEEKFFRSQNPVPSQYLVIFRDNYEGEDQSVLANDLATQYVGQLLQCPYAPGVNGFSVEMSEPYAIALSEDELVQYVQEIPASGFPRAGSGTNVALAANGAQAFASSTVHSNYPVSAIINGDRRGAGWGKGSGGWQDATPNSFPDYLEIHFAGEKKIDQIDLFTLQDSFKNPAEPNEEMTFSLYGVTSFRLNYWDSSTSQWVMLTQVDGNDKVWRTVKFPAVVTPKLSIMILDGANSYSRVVEIEAWEAVAPDNTESTAREEDPPVTNEPVYTGPTEDPEETGELIVGPVAYPPGDFPDVVSAAPTPTPTPVENLKLSSDKKYFVFDNRTIALVGNSGSYVPHIARNRTKNGRYDPVFENCTFDEVGGTLPDGVTKKRKFHVCVDQIVASGLNHMQIWVTLNHSLGMLRKEGPDPVNNAAGSPYADEQPFKRAGNQWDFLSVTQQPVAQAFNNQFFNNLKQVMAYCQDKRVVVGVVLFDPWSGWTENPDVPSISPWWASNNNLNKQFLDPRHFAKSDSYSLNTTGDITKAIDNNSNNKTLREIQVALLKRTVLALKDFRNFYWVLSNEPDLGGAAVGQPLITWLRYMANNLRANEPLANRHLIAVNVTTNPASIQGHPPDSTSPTNPSTTKVITAMTQTANVDIITSHYVQLKDGVGPSNGRVAQDDRYGAIKLIRSFNNYTNGAPNIDNTKVWGFSEDRPTGVRNWDPVWAPSPPSVFTSYDPTWAAAAVRVEAWEFLMSGGGLFDHLSYRWGNLANVNPPFAWNKGNEPQAILARTQLGYLGKFMGTLDLDGMKRTMTSESSTWIKLLPTYGNSNYWAAMSRQRSGSGAATKYESFLFYFHRSKLFSTWAKYEPYNVDEALTTITIRATQMPFAGCYRADWYAPSGETLDGKVALNNGALIPTQTVKFFSSGLTAFKDLTSPKYKQDVLLKISWVQAGQCPP